MHSIGYKFHWKAMVDPSTALASSLEESQAGKRSRPPRFLDYPTWLCSGKVSLGLLELRGDSKVAIRGTPWVVLAFGKPKRSSLEWGDRAQVAVRYPITGGFMTKAPGGHLYFGSKTTPDACQLQTQIVDYQSTLVGSGPWYRRRLYLGTQSLVHAFTMWRYHRYCYATTK